ncbi:MAG: undecaprenyl-phosphate glucose phosphotransferase [Phycisphaerae bacterium]|jgi:exopolysaccharide biosynthesis polyprenyl glycosylphosphotransferase
MLKRYAAFFSLLRSIIDIVIIAIVWIAVYFVRFHSGIFETTKGIPSFRGHLSLSLPVICICYAGCLWSGLYKSKRIYGMLRQLVDISKASLLSGLLVLAFLYYLQNEPYSRKLLVLFIAMLFGGLCISHLLAIESLRFLRRRGYNLRYYAVIGAGKKGQLLVRDLKRMGWLGLRCGFFVDNNPSRIGTVLSGAPVYGPIEKLAELIKTKRIDEVFLTLSGSEAQEVYPILESLQCAGLTIRIVPDWGSLMSISDAEAVPIGSQLLFSSAEPPLSGYNIVLKEIFDRLTGLVFLIIFSIPMVIIALLIKLTSKGPVFYKQVRVGMDQKDFEMLKFRTMRVDAEEEDGPQWAKPNDPRRTTIGAWLRRGSLDELPQLINVIKGEMSLVGPRPERPHFVKQFSEEYKKYMLRHKLKAGMTGWAQVNGFRGDTSLKKRLQYDLYYIKNWSFGFDLRILLLTPWRIIKSRNAY